MGPHSQVLDVEILFCKMHQQQYDWTLLTLMTGVAFLVANGTEKIAEFLITDWSTKTKEKTEQKVPSEISYAPAMSSEEQWGYDISPGSVKMEWTKLELEQ